MGETVSVGSTWRIYKGFEPVSQRRVLLKAIPKDVLERSGSAARLRNEVRAAGALEHPGIVRVYGCGDEAGLFYVVMEYADGWHLKERFRVPVPDAVNLSEQLLEALDHAHEVGIIHGKIMPSNLLLTGKGQLRIINFGVTSVESGSPNFQSPEQFKKLPVDRRSDVFSAGLIFYELLTGAHPFPGPPEEVARRVCEQKERPPSQVNSAVLPAFDEVSAKALAKSVEARYPTARAFCDGIRRAFAQEHGANLSRGVSHETIVAFTSSITPRIERQAEPVAPRPEPSRPVAQPPDPPRYNPPQPDPALRPPSTEPVRPLQSVRSSAVPAPPALNPQVAVPQPKPQAPPVVKQGPAAAKLSPQIASRFEHLLGKQPETLAGYLQDASPELDRVLPAFVSTVRAVIGMYEAKEKSDALIPQNIHFDQLGKATIQTAPASAVQGTMLMSNPRYAAPELFSESSGASDGTALAAGIYGLGMIFYEIVLGKRLFQKIFPEQRNDLDWMRWHADLDNKAPALKSLVPDCPAALSDLLESMMEKHAEKRAADLSDILSRLRGVAQRANKTVVLQRPAEVVEAPAADSPVRRQGRWLNLLLFLLLVLGLGWVGLRLWQDPEFLQKVYTQITSYFSRLFQ